MENTRYTINAPSVVSEVIDGEAVIVNMDNGNYYSIDDSGAFVWDLACQGATVEELVSATQEAYAESEVEVGSAVANLLAELLKEELLVKASDQSKAAEGDGGAKTAESTFKAPQLKKYTDMEELLLLDPIHDEGEDADDSLRAG